MTPEVNMLGQDEQDRLIQGFLDNLQVHAGTADEMRQIAQDVPEVATDLELIMAIYGDVDHQPPIEDTYIQSGPLWDLIWDEDAPGGGIQELRDYIDEARTKKLVDSFEHLPELLDFPLLFETATALENRALPATTKKIDRFALLAQQTAFKQQVAARHSLKPDQLQRATEPMAWREFTQGNWQLEEDPPTYNVPEVTDEDDGESFILLKANAIMRVSPYLVSLLKDHDENIRGPIDRKSVRDVDTYQLAVMPHTEDPHDVMYYLTIVTDKNIRIEAPFEKIVAALYNKQDALTLDDQLLLCTAMALDECESAYEFKAHAAAHIHEVRTGMWIPPLVDSDFFAQSNIYDLLIENAVLQGADIQFSHSARNLRNPKRNRGGETTISAEYKQTATNIPDARSELSQGEIVVPEKHWNHLNRMICFSAEQFLPEEEVIAKDYDIAITMKLPHGIDQDGRVRSVLPHIDGYSLVGWQPGDAITKATLQFQKVEGHDPYGRVGVTIDQSRLPLLADQFTAIGLPICAEQLLDEQPTTLRDVTSIISRHSVYGNFGKEVTKTVEAFEDLADFVDDDTLTGVCSVSAAVVKMAIDTLMPSASAEVVNGFLLRYESVHLMGHAQVRFWHQGQPYITWISPRIVNPPKPSNMFENNAGQPEPLRLVVENGSGMVGMMLNKKYALPHDNPKDLIAVVARETALNFGRQVCGLFMRTYGLLNEDSATEQLPVLHTEAQKIRQQITDWQNFPTPTKRPKEFGQWADDELAILANNLDRFIRASKT